ncbi:MAG: response regulator transcription factor [bacterium]|nr:response regulator transcription factor [bacterium]
MSTATDCVQVLILSRQRLFYHALARLLSVDPTLAVRGYAADPQHLAAVRGYCPDVVLLELGAPHLETFHLTRQLLSTCPDVRLLLLADDDADDVIVRAIKARAAGYLRKDTEPAALLRAIHDATSGAPHAAGDSAVDLAIGAVKETEDGKQFTGLLSLRQVEVLRLLAQGMTNKEIAKRVGIREKTVRNHISAMYSRLGVDHRSEAMLYAIRKGLVDA